MGLSVIPQDPKERFMSKIEMIPFHSCHEWIGHKENGYGRFGMGYGKRGWRLYWAHRISYEMFIGPIPEGLTVDHLCRNKGCVNPKHMEIVTRSENISRSHKYRTYKRKDKNCGQT